MSSVLFLFLETSMNEFVFIPSRKTASHLETSQFTTKSNRNLIGLDRSLFENPLPKTTAFLGEFFSAYEERRESVELVSPWKKMLYLEKF